MPGLYDKLNKKKEQELKVLAGFIGIFCRKNHRDRERAPFIIRDARLESIPDIKKLSLCADCQKLLDHGIAKLLMCPHDPKPMCKKCQTHCYAPGYRQRIREVMKYSGLYLIKHGRLDLIIHYYR